MGRLTLNSSNFTRHALAAASAALLLSACGGGGDDGASTATGPSTTPPTTPSVAALSISGTAATGLAISGGAVDVKCATGSGAATTAADGSYTATVTSGVLPCVLRVTSGSTVLHSVVADGTGALLAANITPLTELVVARMLQAAPSALFDEFSASTQAALTPSAVAAAVTEIRATLQGTVDLSGVDPLKDTLVAATSTSSGNALDVLLDTLGVALSQSQSSLAELTTAVAAAPASNSGSAPAKALLQPAAATCGAFRSGTYRVLNPHETNNDLDYVSHTVTFDAKLMKMADDSLPEPRTWLDVAAVEGSNCRFTYEGDFGTETALISPTGVAVVLSPAINGKTRLSFMIPEQATPLANLAGTWNYLSYERDSLMDNLHALNGQVTLDANGTMSNGLECAPAVCAPWTDAMPSLVAHPKGGYSVTEVPGTFTAGTSRLFPFTAANGETTIFVLEPEESGISFFTREKPLTLPGVGHVSKFWDVQLNASALRWMPGQVFTAGDSSVTVTAVDTAARTVTRIRASDSRVDTLAFDQPRTGMRSRAAAGTVPAMVMLPLPGAGMSVYTNASSAQNFFGLSIDQR